MLLVWTLILLANPQLATGSKKADPTAEVDPDLPSPDATTALVDKEEYLRRRADYFLSLRGFEAGEMFDPNVRVKALEKLDAQEEELFTNLRRAAADAGPYSPEMQEFTLGTTMWTELGPAPIPNGQTEVTSTAVSGPHVRDRDSPVEP